jgi:hypothetical protein
MLPFIEETAGFLSKNNLPFSGEKSTFLFFQTEEIWMKLTTLGDIGLSLTKLSYLAPFASRKELKGISSMKIWTRVSGDCRN